MRDMREILELARADAPPPRSTVDDLVAAGRRRHRRLTVARRAGGAGVAATLAVVIGTLMSLQPHSGGGFATGPAAEPAKPEVATASPPFTFTFAGFSVDNYRVLAPDQVNPAYQVATIVRDNKDTKEAEFVGSLTVFQPGVFNPELFQQGTRVTVGGRDAFQAQLAHKLLTEWHMDRYANTDTINTDALAWQYAPNAWAVIDSEMFTSEKQQPFDYADQTRLAEQFRPGTGDPLPARLPFQAGYLPDGFQLVSVDGQSMAAEGRGMTTFAYSKPDNALSSVTGRRDFFNTSPGPAAVISILWVDSPPPDAVARTSRCNAGQHWCMRNLPGNEFWVSVSDPSKSLSDEELLRVIDGLTFASIKEPSTWFAVS
jgi:hypothetical protein